MPSDTSVFANGSRRRRGRPPLEESAVTEKSALNCKISANARKRVRLAQVIYNQRNDDIVDRALLTAINAHGEFVDIGSKRAAKSK